jgi:hypothetical protein
VRCRRGVVSAAAMASCLVLGCAGVHRPPASAGESQPDEGVALLRQRAERLWRARALEDWSTAFQFREPSMRQGQSEADFVAWCEEHEPFRVLSFRLGDVLTDGHWGWVEVDCRTRMRRFPAAPPQDVVRWEKWRRVEGEWYPVPREELDCYPASPALRDLAEEGRLLVRVQEACDARERQDWRRFYELHDPRERPDVSETELSQMESMVVYLSHNVHWVEVVGDHGTARVECRLRMSDPSLTKLPARVDIRNERWNKVDGEWYLAMKQPEP